MLKNTNLTHLYALMKNTIAALALTTLAAAASAQTAAAPAGLSYNRIGFTRTSQKGLTNQNVLSVSSLLGSSNFLAFAENRTDHGTALGLGYVFKNVAVGIDAAVTVSADNEWQSNSSIYSLGLRRSLSEVFAGLEVAIGYSTQSTALSAGTNRVLSYELSYNINKQYTVAYGIQDIRKGLLNGSAEKIQNVSVRYNF